MNRWGQCDLKYGIKVSVVAFLWRQSHPSEGITRAHSAYSAKASSSCIFLAVLADKIIHGDLQTIMETED